VGAEYDRFQANRPEDVSKKEHRPTSGIVKNVESVKNMNETNGSQSDLLFSSPSK
jgi:hypothetical protein